MDATAIKAKMPDNASRVVDKGIRLNSIESLYG